MSDVQVFAFINRFVEPARLEVVIDWTDDWPDRDPFAGAEFKLSHGGGGFDTPLTEITIPEVREQLIVVGHDAATDAHRIANISLLAPKFVTDTAGLITGPVVTFGAFAATSMSDLGKPQLFGGENLLADLERWVTEPTPDERADRVVTRPTNTPPPPQPDEMLNSVNTLLRATGRPPAAAFRTSAVAAATATATPNPNEVVRNPQQFRALIRDANAAGMEQDVKTLADVIRRRAVAEQLLYAEALRRDQYYSRIRGEDKPGAFTTMTATTDPLKLRRDRRADIRRISRDEPVVGAMFFVLRWFDLPKDIDSWVGQDIRVLPFGSGSPMNGFKAIETRVGSDGTRTITILRRDGVADYFARTVFVRQLAPALLLESEAPTIEEMLAVGQACPRITTGNSEQFVFAVEALNNHAHDPRQVERERNLIEADARREMRDAAESVRRNLPPYDAIGITWERTLVGAMTRGEMKTPFHSGFKGYRIDVREAGGDSSWKSLCTVEREVFDKNGEAVVRTRRPREGYVMQPVQNHSANKDEPTVLTMPSDFVVWAGGSVVVPAPLDRVGEALAPPPADGPLISMRENGTTKIHPRFGREYEFRVRGVGLSGVGPDTSVESTTAARDSVMFKRGVLMDAPRAEATFVDLVPVDENCEPLPPEKATPDALLFAKSRDARIEIETSLPLAHWRVALHARGVSAGEVTEKGGARLENACERYVARTRENWRRRLAGIREAEKLKPAAFLSAVDPHCGSIELVTKAWFPFSTNANADRYIVVGREEHKRRDIRDATFSELVAMGEEIIDTERLDDRFTISIDGQTLPANETPQRAPRMLAGFRGRGELSATWSSDAVTHFKDGEGRRRWTRELFGGTKDGRAIGGSVGQFGQTFEAGGPTLNAGDLFVDAAYSAIEDLEKERDLILPQPPPPTGPSCEVSQAPPTRADAVRWRKKFFDDDCSEQPATPSCLAQRAIYRAFVAQQLGAVDLHSLPTATPALRDRYRNQLAVVLKPMLADPTLDRKKSLVVPVFTFPDQTSYAEDVDLGSAFGNTRSTIAKVGEFGSAGVTSVTVTAGGSLYDANNPPEVVFESTSGSGARGKAVVDGSGKITGVDLEDGGHDYDTEPVVTFQSKSGSGAAATAAIGPSAARKLPWVDADVIWSVRIGWRVPLRGSRVERPLELAAVREFRLFRSERDECGNEVKRRMATIRRPGSDTLERIDLDQVEFTWIDAITDRDLHEFTYSITAVPEDCNTFKEQDWYSLKVNVPDSRITARPESTRYVPMLAKQDGVGTTRSLAVYFSDAAVRSNADGVSYFFARAADDPMLSIKPVAKVDGGRAPFIPTRWAQVFPANRIVVQRVRKMEELAAVRGDLDGIFAGMLDCPDVQDRRSRVFLVSSKTDGKPLVKPTASSEIGNPFFKLHLSTYDSKRFPALAHTSASEPAESDWLQFYPDDLRWSPDPKLELLAPWGDGSQTAENHIWYRFHFFAQATETLSFHVSTFYSQAPELAFDAARSNAAVASFRRFAGTVPSCLRLFVRAEEGLLAESYAITEDQTTKTLKVDNTLTPVHFVVLRSTPEAKEVQIGCTTPPT